MCPGKLPEVRHRPQMLLWDVIALQHQVDVCEVDLLLGFSYIFSSILNFGGPCHTLFYGQLLRRNYIKVDWGGTLFLQKALQFAGQCQLCSKGGKWHAVKCRELSWITGASSHQWNISVDLELLVIGSVFKFHLTHKMSKNSSKALAFSACFLSPWFLYVCSREFRYILCSCGIPQCHDFESWKADSLPCSVPWYAKN